MIQALITTVLFAMSAVSAGRSTRMLGGSTANLSRLVLATACLALWAHIWGQGLTGPGLPWLLISGVIGFGMGDLGLYAAYPRIGARLGVLLCLCLAVPLGAIAEWVWLGTTLTLAQILWSTLIVVGVVLALAPDHRMPVAARTWAFGICCGVVAAMGQGGGAVFTRKAFTVAKQVGQEIDGGTAAYQRIIAGVLLTSIVVAAHRWARRADPAGESAGGEHPWKRAWPWVVANALTGPTLGVACFQWALREAPTGVVLAIVATTPLVVIPFTMVLDGERPTLRSLVGGAAAVLGAAALAWHP